MKTDEDSDIFQTNEMIIATENILVNNGKSSTPASEKFDDSLEHFITIIKKITKAYTINIYSAKPLYQIYLDSSDESPIILSNEEGLNKFLRDYNSSS